jgi:hypothetical protein
MPSRNSVKSYDAPAYYHVYNRGAGKQTIFHDARDKDKFISLLVRHLDPADKSARSDGVVYEKYDVRLVAYCLMNNHFHLMLYQESDTEAVTKLLRSVSTAYTMYFNKRYERQGHLFQGVFRASEITSETYLIHITRYIHLNPRTYKTYRWSSLGAYLGNWSTPWLYHKLVNDMTPTRYLEFLEDYEERKEILDTIKKQLGI